MNPAQWLVRTAALAPQAPALFKGARLEADYAEFLVSGGCFSRLGCGRNTGSARAIGLRCS